MTPRSSPGEAKRSQDDPKSPGVRGGLLAPSGVDFGPSGAPFSKLPALLAEPCGEQAQAQKRKRRRKRKAQAQGAQSQGQQAARPPSFKDSGARRDVRSTLIKRRELFNHWLTCSCRGRFSQTPVRRELESPSTQDRPTSSMLRSDCRFGFFGVEASA